MTIQNIAFSSKLPSIEKNTTSFAGKTKEKEPVVVKNQDTLVRSYYPKEQGEREEYEIKQEIEKENVKKVNQLVLKACDEPLTEENKETLNNSLTEMLKDSKLSAKKQEKLKEMVSKTLEKFPDLSDAQKKEFKEKLENVDKSPFNSKNLGCSIMAIIFLTSPDPITKVIGGLWLLCGSLGLSIGLTDDSLFWTAYGAY